MAANCLQRRACDGRPIVDNQSVEQYDQAHVDADRQLPAVAYMAAQAQETSHRRPGRSQRTVKVINAR